MSEDSPHTPSPSGRKDGKRRKHRNSTSQNTIVIHVCDESKKINQDFHCSRELLVEEMKYFAEYLATDIKICEEVDISVHCDVQIFDWLMRYVQRDKTVPMEECPNMPRLEPTNVISILISSDFLKMDELVKLCIEYCHGHINDIISAPCNMTCINGDILTSIASLFSLSEIEAVHDRKDKFKSKLFAKKVESLLEDNTLSTGLFRCTACLRILTSTLQCKVPCVTGRITVGYNGVLMYSHTKDGQFDVSQYLISLRQSGKSWRAIYWRVWSSINYLSCTTCHHTFPIREFYQCLHHPDEPVFKDGEDQISAAVGVYPCCRQKALRFDPLTCPKGCEKIKHSVSVGADCLDKSKYSDDPISLMRLFEQHEDVIIDLNESDKVFPATGYNMFVHEELMCGVSRQHEQQTLDKQSNLNSIQIPSELDSESVEGVDEEETEDEEVTQIIKKRQQTNKKKAKGSKGVRHKSQESSNHGNQNNNIKDRVEVYVESVSSDGTNVMGGGDYASSKMRWDARRSRRWNQDAQRDDDKKRTGELVNQLNNLKLQMKRTDITKSKDCHVGGLYYLLENKFKAQNKSTTRENSSNVKISRRRTILSLP